MQKFGVWCMVWGGVTGHRQAWLKGSNGQTKVFESLIEAASVASHLTDKLNSNPYRKANFHYSVRPLGERT